MVKRALLALPLLWAGPSAAQFAVDDTQTPQALIEQVFAGSGVTVSNVTFQQSTVATPQEGMGSFSNSTAELGLASGVLLTTSHVSSVADDAEVTASDSLNVLTDPDLEAIVGAGTSLQDRVVVEFDVVPSGTTLRFNYVFASDEYPIFVCSYNDAFGLFISGPGINGPYTNNAENFARIPGSGLPVSLNSAMNVIGATDCPPSDPQYFVNNETGTSIVYNGLTTVFQARANVQCGATYHVKMALADALDHGCDSGVFLEAASLSSGSFVTPSLLPGPGVQGNTFTTGCADVVLRFERDGQGVLADTLPLLAGGSAQAGSDYLPALPPSLIFAPGDTIIDILLHVPADADGTELITLTLPGNTSCLDPDAPTAFTFTLLGFVPLHVRVPVDTTVCANSELVLHGEVLGGVAPVEVHWADAAGSGPDLTVVPAYAQDHTLLATDACGNMAEATVHVEVVAPIAAIRATRQGPFTWALSQPVQPDATVEWELGDGTSSTAIEVMHTYRDAAEHWVVLTVTGQLGCTAVDSMLLPAPTAFYLPSAFTPNSDGINDVFRAAGEGLNSLELEVYDRWGTSVFRSTARQEGWDGLLGGDRPAPVGLYVVRYRLVPGDGPPQEGYGHVLLMR